MHDLGDSDLENSDEGDAGASIPTTQTLQ